MKFFNAYLDIEHEGSVATYSASDEVVNELRTKSMGFWHASPGTTLSPSFGRPMGMHPDQLATLARSVNLARRTLFMVAEYRRPDGETLYAAFTSGDRTRTTQSYGGLLHAAEVEGELKIVASYKEDFDKASPPVHWRHSQGAEINLSGAPVAVRPLEAPTGQAAHQEDWEGLRDSVTGP
ncbi:hypothetical protein ACIQRW_07910 [Streptomyces sp. NPDC091287]|uniref:hypothetical protein n=1 Tax=Streptomyces sp. NPDC091287 TaxID=3365988 RepID=UPI0037F1FD4F